MRGSDITLRPLPAVLLAFLLAGYAPTLHSQLVSPGKLSTVHAALDGVNDCAKCHNFGDKSVRVNCLACHAEIRSRVERGLGYHAFTKKLECSACHKEHHGRDFKLIRWDPAKFDHRQAGFELVGKHAGKECRACHIPKNIVQKEIRGKSAAAKQRTYLGLEPACINCHTDGHAGQLGSDCARCHTPADWKQNSFTHSRARFPLLGKHADVACTKCHPPLPGATGTGMAAMKLHGLAFKTCGDCHEDKHKGQFGKDCAQCHTPESWKSVRLSSNAGFDHSKTRFALQGRHASLACAKCHVGGDIAKYRNKELGSCLLCHADAHAGQFAQARGGTECSRCHTVDGFHPSRFEQPDHATTRFPLEGAHAAVACDRCHTTETRDGTPVRRFRWTDLACTSCHSDYHAGQFLKRPDKGACNGCHSTASWHSMEFDHAATDFPLRGKHLAVPCDKCHGSVEIGGAQTRRFTFDSITCASCHTDPHGGQFVVNGTVTCERCHSTGEWKPSTFDHTRDSRFQLNGRHAALACSACHRATAGESGGIVRYKPIDPDCATCHPASDTEKKMQ
ncbi:MAG: cytochrome C [Ignavibacteriae bacterium]|nr:cytochrome C [Ignavibacteriota bacterium]